MERTDGKLNVAKNLIRLRKKHGLTQNQLAARLYVSNKTVSKWECDNGYPEITQLLRIADVFGVSVDELLRDERNGIALVGSVGVDAIKNMEVYPDKNMLTKISSVSNAVGGCVPNVSIDLAKIDRSLSLSAHGMVGDDQNGKYIVYELQKHGIDVNGILISKDTPTAFCDVMTDVRTGERTFFSHLGTNSVFSPSHVRLSTLNCKMLHAGYIYLLDEFDAPDAEYGTAMARFLHDVKELEIKTSFDVLSDKSLENFAAKVLPVLPFTDNVIVNEHECCRSAGLSARDADGTLLLNNVKQAMQFLMEQGVGERVIVHAPEVGFLLNRKGDFTTVPSLKLPEGYVKGSVGAGDAFCAGCLYAIYQNRSDKEILEFSSAAAACNLSAEDSVGGMKEKSEIYRMMEQYPRQELSFIK